MASPFSDLDRPPLSPRALGRALVTPEGLWSRIDVRAQTRSTNADVSAAALRGEPEGLVIVAEQQTAGRGRRDRLWVSPPRAGLTLSMLLRPGDAGVAAGAYAWLPLLAGVALVEAVRRVAEVDAVLKWPNDLLVSTGKPAGNDTGESAGNGAEKTAGNGAGMTSMGKAAGILAEVAGDAVVVGIGLNVTTSLDELPETAGLPATSLRVAGAANTDRDPLLRAFLRGFAGWYRGWLEAGADAEMSGLLTAYRRDCATIGRAVRVLLPAGDPIEGEAVAVDNDGQLVVRTADGVDHRISAGDVLHVR
jgi:BirA family biotin operon repressor/biotin-[acetyl-CoA-carboxylase] ligase